MNQNSDIDPVHSFSGGNQLDDQQKTSDLIIRAIFENTHTSIFLIDPEYKVIFLNKKGRDRCKMIYGKDIEIGDCILDYRTENDETSSKLFRESFTEALHGERIVNEQKLIFPSNTSWVRFEYNPVYDQGEIVGVLVRCVNINERKEYELQIAKQDERLKKIAWMQSHETRQPVATILGLVNIIDKKSLTDDNKEILALLEKTVQKLDDVIRKTVVQASSVDDI